MIKFDKEYYVIRYKSGEIMGIDKDSGGYPFKAYHPAQIHYFNDIEEAHKYARMFKELGSITLVYGLESYV